MDVVNREESVFGRKSLAIRALGLLLTMSLTTWATGETPETGSPLAELPAFGAMANPPAPAGSTENKGQGGITCQILPNPQGHYTAFVFDSVRGVLAVYMVDQGTGQINLKSVRQVSWDLRLEEFNTNQPSPSDLRDSQR